MYKLLNLYLKFILLNIEGNTPNISKFIYPKAEMQLTINLWKWLEKEIWEPSVLLKVPTIFEQDGLSSSSRALNPKQIVILQSSHKKNYLENLWVNSNPLLIWRGIIKSWSTVFTNSSLSYGGQIFSLLFHPHLPWYIDI